MAYKNQPWFSDLQLNEELFASLPQGENPLIWAIQNKHLNDENYAHWASEYYQLPRLHDHFFSMAMDHSLPKKYANTYPWNSLCYPVYEWEEVLYVACLEPPQIQEPENICFVIATMEAMERGWSHDTPQAPTVHETQAEEMPQTPKVSKEPLDSLNFSDADVSDEPQQPVAVSFNDDMDPLEELERTRLSPNSTLNIPSIDPLEEMERTRLSPNSTLNIQAIDSSEEFEENSTQAPASQQMEPESTEIDFNLPDLKAKTEEKAPLKTPPPPVPNLDFSDLGLNEVNKSFNEFESIKSIEQKKEAFVNSGPSEDQDIDTLLKEISFDHINDDPKKHKPAVKPAATVDDRNEEEFDDDITPPPTHTNISALHELNTPTPMVVESETQVDVPEITETDQSTPVYIPKEKKITNEDLKKFASLDNCHGTKEIMSHIFCHLTKDYQKLMWVELSESGQFFPRFVYGPWKMDTTSWNYPVDVSKPNIFRIAFVSSLPFHGPVKVNKINSNYFQWWNHGSTPDVVTVYPVVFDEACYGFITCFGKGPEFDETDSLKKIENLLAICAKVFHKIHLQKAS